MIPFTGSGQNRQIHRDKRSISVCQGLVGEGDARMGTANGPGFLLEWQNVLNVIVVMTAPLREYINNHWIVYFKLRLCDLHLRFVLKITHSNTPVGCYRWPLSMTIPLSESSFISKHASHRARWRRRWWSDWDPVWTFLRLTVYSEKQTPTCLWQESDCRYLR